MCNTQKRQPPYAAAHFARITTAPLGRLGYHTSHRALHNMVTLIGPLTSMFGFKAALSYAGSAQLRTSEAQHCSAIVQKMHGFSARRVCHCTNKSRHKVAR